MPKSITPSESWSVRANNRNNNTSSSWSQLLCPCIPSNRNPSSSRQLQTNQDIEMRDLRRYPHGGTYFGQYPSQAPPQPPRQQQQRPQTSTRQPSTHPYNNPSSQQNSSWWTNADSTTVIPPTSPSQSRFLHSHRGIPNHSPQSHGSASISTSTSDSSLGSIINHFPQPPRTALRSILPQHQQQYYGSGAAAAATHSGDLASPNSLYSSYTSVHASLFPEPLVIDSQRQQQQQQQQQRQPPSPTSSIDSLDFFSGGPSRAGFGSSTRSRQQQQQQRRN
jgi:hypothetical protein